VSDGVLGVASHRFRATFGRRWQSYLTKVLLVGLVGGIGMGAIAAADLALLMSPAFTQGHLGAAVAWQASVDAVVGSAGDGSGSYSPARSMRCPSRPFPS
jgi:hypothetical protein